MSSWNWVDWTLATVIVASVVPALLKGFTRELISLASVVAGVIIAALGYRRAGAGFEDLARSHEVALGAGFLALFLGTWAVGAMVSVFAQRLVKSAGLQWFDRFLGGIFGLVRGVIIDCVLLLALVAFAIKVDPVEQSLLAPYLLTGARVIALAMPRDLKAQFRDGFEKFRQALIQNDKKVTKNF